MSTYQIPPDLKPYGTEGVDYTLGPLQRHRNRAIRLKLTDSSGTVVGVSRPIFVDRVLPRVYYPQTSALSVNEFDIRPFYDEWEWGDLPTSFNIPVTTPTVTLEIVFHNWVDGDVVVIDPFLYAPGITTQMVNTGTYTITNDSNRTCTITHTFETVVYGNTLLSAAHEILINAERKPINDPDNPRTLNIDFYPGVYGNHNLVCKVLSDIVAVTFETDNYVPNGSLGYGIARGAMSTGVGVSHYENTSGDWVYSNGITNNAVLMAAGFRGVVFYANACKWLRVNEQFSVRAAFQSHALPGGYTDAVTIKVWHITDYPGTADYYVYIPESATLLDTYRFSFSHAGSVLTDVCKLKFNYNNLAATRLVGRIYTNL